MTISFLFLLASVAVPVSSLNNGFTLPAIGYSTWNDCSSFRDNGADGWCWDSEAHIKNITLYMISSGLAKLGYNRCVLISLMAACMLPLPCYYSLHSL